MSQFPVHDPRFGPPPPTPRTSGVKTLLIVLGIFGGIFLLTCGACCGVGAWTIRTGLAKDARRVEARIQDHPVVLDKIGALQECKYSFTATTNRGFEDAEYDRVFEIKGTKGNGLVLTSELFGQYVSILLR